MNRKNEQKEKKRFGWLGRVPGIPTTFPLFFGVKRGENFDFSLQWREARRKFIKKNNLRFYLARSAEKILRFYLARRNF